MALTEKQLNDFMEVYTKDYDFEPIDFQSYIIFIAFLVGLIAIPYLIYSLAVII